MISVLLTLEQAMAVATAIRAEIRKGEGTFLDYDDVAGLTMVVDAIDSQVEHRILAQEAL